MAPSISPKFSWFGRTRSSTLLSVTWDSRRTNSTALQQSRKWRPRLWPVVPIKSASRQGIDVKNKRHSKSESPHPKLTPANHIQGGLKSDRKNERSRCDGAILLVPAGKPRFHSTRIGQMSLRLSNVGIPYHAVKTIVRHKLIQNSNCSP